jgi:hypothetical protein
MLTFNIISMQQSVKVEHSTKLHPGHYFVMAILSQINSHLDDLEVKSHRCTPQVSDSIAKQYEFWDGLRVFLLNEGDFCPTDGAVVEVLTAVKELKDVRKIDLQGRKVSYKSLQDLYPLSEKLSSTEETQPEI